MRASWCARCFDNLCFGDPCKWDCRRCRNFKFDCHKKCDRPKDCNCKCDCKFDKVLFSDNILTAWSIGVCTSSRLGVGVLYLDGLTFSLLK